MKNYDTIVGVGCSFMNGDAVSDEDGFALNRQHKMRPAIFLSEKLNCNEVNLATTGSSNDGMFRRIYNWVEDNKNKKTLMIIGLIYNQEQEDSKLQRNVMMLHYYLKGNNIDYYIFNSLEDSLGDIKDKINYISFKKPEIDSWYRYLRYEMQEVDNNNFKDSVKYRSPKPPYGRQFCNGHPSPRAQEKLAERIYKELDK